MRLSDASAAVPKHVITLPVQVPRVAFVNTVDLVLVGGDGKPLKDDATVTVGHLVAAELQVKHTRAWNGSGREVEPMEFVYEIQADSTTWLVGGRRRSRFYAAVGSARCRHISQGTVTSLLTCAYRRTSSIVSRLCYSLYDLDLFFYLR